MSALTVPIDVREKEKEIADQKTMEIAASPQSRVPINIHYDYKSHTAKFLCPAEVRLEGYPPRELILEADCDCRVTFNNQDAFGVTEVQLVANRPVPLRALEWDIEQKTRCDVTVYVGTAPVFRSDRGGPIIIIPPSPN